MRTNNGLFDLVQSMTAPEVSYFKKYARLYSQKQKPNYLRIFEVIKKQVEYDEDLILKKFRKERFVKNFAVAKKDLKEKILEALCSYHGGQQIDTKLQKSLEVLPILYDKCLYPLLKRSLNALRKSAEEECAYTILLEVNSWEQKLVFLRPARKRLEILDGLYLENEWLLEKIMELKRMENQCHKLGYFLNNDLVLRDPLRQQQYLELAKSNLDKINPDELSWDYKVLFYKTLGLTKYIENDPDAAFLIYEKLIKLFNPATTGNRQVQVYKKALCDYVNTAFRAGKMEKAIPVLEILRELPSSSLSEDADTFNIASFLGLVYYLNAEKWEEVRQLIAYIEEKWPLYESYIKLDRKLAFYYNIFVFYFVNSEWPAALAWLQKILKHANAAERRDIQGAARILQLVAFYELEEWDNLENRLASGSRNLKKNNQFLLFEAATIRFFQKLIQSYSRKEQETLRHGLAEELETLARHPTEKNALGLEELRQWLGRGF